MMTSILGWNALLLAACVLHFAACAPDFLNPDSDSNCRTPDGKSGSCVNLRNCQAIINLIKAKGISSPEVSKLVRDSTCGFSGSEPKVCCAGSTDDRDDFNGGGNKVQGNSKESGDDPNQPFENPLSLLPQKCGEDFSQRIIGGERTELDEFPWMAVLEFDTPRGKTSGCGGALITQRYVLTAAHCVRSIPSNWRLSSVRLGEYDMTSNPDCVDEGNGEQTCADPVQIVNIERAIVHEDYMKPQNYHNDIALLRLVRNVATTTYVQPICLPTSAAVSQLYWSAGWGQIERKASSNVKLKVSLPYVDFNECSRVYSTRRIYLASGQMCAGGRAGKDTCKGDSGGPLMKQTMVNGKNKWVVDGVVSFGHTPCGLQGWPAVYTKVNNYVPWIINKLRP